MLVNSKLAIKGALLKGVKTNCVHIMQGRTYRRKRRHFGRLLLHTYYKIARDCRIAGEHGMVKTNGSWVKLDTPAQKIRVIHPPSHHPEVDAYIAVPAWKTCMHSRKFFLFVQTDLSYCISLMAIVKVSYETTLLHFSLWNHLSLYILHVKDIKIISLF